MFCWSGYLRGHTMFRKNITITPRTVSGRFCTAKPCSALLGFNFVERNKPVGLYSSKPTLIRVLKCFNLPSSPPPTRGSGKERIWGKWTCLERFFGATPICVVWKSAVQFTGQQWQLDPLHGYISNPFRESRVSKQESAAVALPSRDCQASARLSGRDPEGHQEQFLALPLSGRSVKT